VFQDLGIDFVNPFSAEKFKNQFLFRNFRQSIILKRRLNVMVY
jgi:hypothetical protein